MEGKTRCEADLVGLFSLLFNPVLRIFDRSVILFRILSCLVRLPKCGNAKQRIRKEVIVEWSRSRIWGPGCSAKTRGPDNERKKQVRVWKRRTASIRERLFPGSFMIRGIPPRHHGQLRRRPRQEGGGPCSEPYGHRRDRGAQRKTIFVLYVDVGTTDTHSLVFSALITR